jgi:hypothetical protein
MLGVAAEAGPKNLARERPAMLGVAAEAGPKNLARERPAMLGVAAEAGPKNLARERPAMLGVALRRRSPARQVLRRTAQVPASQLWPGIGRRHAPGLQRAPLSVTA